MRVCKCGEIKKCNRGEKEKKERKKKKKGKSIVRESKAETCLIFSFPHLHELTILLHVKTYFHCTVTYCTASECSPSGLYHKMQLNRTFMNKKIKMVVIVLRETFVALSGFNRQSGHGTPEDLPVKFHITKLWYSINV